MVSVSASASVSVKGQSDSRCPVMESTGAGGEDRRMEDGGWRVERCKNQDERTRMASGYK